VKELLNDLLATIFFFIVYWLTGSILVSTGIAIAVGLGQLGYMKLKGRPIDLMQWLALGLVVAFGGATLATQDLRFIMVKPSIIHFAIAAVMLRPNWLARYMPKIATDNLPPMLVLAYGYAWAALMAGLGVANLVIALNFDPQVWAWFLSFGAVGAKLAFFGAQYVLFRGLVRRRIRQRLQPLPAVSG